MLHPQSIPSLALLPDDKHVHLLTRHSIREAAEGKVASYQLPLTDEGIRLAEQWGEMLRRPVEYFYSSAVGRCVETAKAMARGLRESRALQGEPSIEFQQILMEPGSYVQEMALVGQTFIQVGPLAFVSMHLSEKLTDGLVSPEQGAGNFIQYFRQKNGSDQAMSVHVTHDTILAAFVYYLMGVTELSETDWPWMMEGVFLWFEKNSIHWVWRGIRHSKDLVF